jgi:nicotinate-nucleotide pyrophosphorylase (carboxylating)
MPTPFTLDFRDVRRLIDFALEEDVGGGDLTVQAVLTSLRQRDPVRASIVAKADGVVAGLLVAREVFATLDRGIGFAAAVSDGDRVTPGTVVATVHGPCGAMLTGERTAMNLLGQLSGTATYARRLVEAVDGLPVEICDTRKTVPGMRMLQKYAARLGGARNHRIGLYDQILIKENHLSAAGVTIGEAIKRARVASQLAPRRIPIGAEAKNLAEVEQALAARADVILLDNFNVDEVPHAVTLRDAAFPAGPGERPQLEASGGIHLGNVRAYAEAGVDRISIGAITHSAPALDLSCLFDFSDTGPTA